MDPDVLEDFIIRERCHVLRLRISSSPVVKSRQSGG
jgi:hypothetical protein